MPFSSLCLGIHSHQKSKSMLQRNSILLGWACMLLRSQGWFSSQGLHSRYPPLFFLDLTQLGKCMDSDTLNSSPLHPLLLYVLLDPNLLNCTGTGVISNFSSLIFFNDQKLFFYFIFLSILFFSHTLHPLLSYIASQPILPPPVPPSLPFYPDQLLFFFHSKQTHKIDLPIVSTKHDPTRYNKHGYKPSYHGSLWQPRRRKSPKCRQKSHGQPHSYC